MTATDLTCSSQIFITATFRNDAQILGDVLEIYKATVDNILDIADFLPSLVYQPLQLAVIAKFAKNGGNALGIDASDGPLTSMIVLAVRHGVAADTSHSHGYQLHLEQPC